MNKDQQTYMTLDANEAVARIAYALNEVVAIYPITPASPMGEFADQWAAMGQPNMWGKVPRVIEMQSEGGAAGVVHGALQAGSLTTTFTASQGLLLMLPNMFKIAGELTANVIHVAARSIAAQALSIFGDHSDVMAARTTGYAMLASNGVQEAMDMALIAHAASLRARVPFLHFFDGFRTSHEISKVATIPEDVMRALIRDEDIFAHRQRGLNPDEPALRGTAQNPDVYFQGREAGNGFYIACSHVVAELMETFGELTGRHYKPYEYHGAENAERVVVGMGSACETLRATVDHLVSQGEKVGMLSVRLFRPLDGASLISALPKSIQSLAILDRTKEPGSLGEPLYLDVGSAYMEAVAAGSIERMPRIIGGRYGLSSKEFTPSMVCRIFEELGAENPRNHFTIGIHDDVTHTSLEWDGNFNIEDPDCVRAMFYGLGSDGTVGANKNTIKIIGEGTDQKVQGYFVYDSKKSGSMTVSHLRFGPREIRAPYLIEQASFIGVHQFRFLKSMDVLANAEKGATLLLNTPFEADRVWDKLPVQVQQRVIEKGIKVFSVDAYKVAGEVGLGGRINTIMQTCFFAISGVLPEAEAIAAIKKAIVKTYGKRGERPVRLNHAAVDAALAHLHPIEVPAESVSQPFCEEYEGCGSLCEAPDLVAQLIRGRGESVKVSEMSVDGTFPTGTTRFEKRNIAREAPIWDPDVCIQCGKCVLVCPHAVIRGKVAAEKALEGAPEGFLTAPAKWRQMKDDHYTLQVAAEDCTGCGLCVAVCPAKNRKRPKDKALNMRARPESPVTERENWDFFLSLPEVARKDLNEAHVKDVQLLKPMFEFSGACSGCGETPYLKLMSQLFGDRAVIANATGCSSIYGGNLPTTPWSRDAEGRGPAWSNSLFEDNAEFGLGMRVALDERAARARQLLAVHGDALGAELAQALLEADMDDLDGIAAQRERVAALKHALIGREEPWAMDLLSLANDLVKRSLWIVGGDGWAYDIGFGGLDHVLASGANVNILVLDTEVYSNTGGQASKSTPRAAVAKFAHGGKRAPKKDLALMAMSYGNVYVARVAMGANDAQTVKAFREAEAFNGPSLILAYSHCIAHGYDLVHGLEQQKLAMQSGYWPLLRFNPDAVKPLVLDSKKPSIPLKEYIYNETRYTMLKHSQPEVADKLLHEAEEDVRKRLEHYQHLANLQDQGATS